MKRKHILILALILLGLTIVLIFKRNTIRGCFLKQSISQSEYYQLCLKQFEELEIIDGSILFIGNSLMAELNLDELNDDKILKLAIRGDLSSGLRNRLNYIGEHLPDIIFIELGINDILNGIPFSIEEHRRFVKSINESSPETIIYIHSITPTLLEEGFFIKPKIINRQIFEANILIKEFCVNKNLTYIDLYSSFEQNGQLNPKYTYDGVHFNDKGNEIWLELLKTPLNSN